MATPQQEYTDLTARWELIGLDRWLDSSYGEEQVRSAPRIRFLVQWGDDNSVSFVVGFWPHTVTRQEVREALSEGYDPCDPNADDDCEDSCLADFQPYESYELEIRDIQDDSTDGEWLQQDFDVDFLYHEARELCDSGERSGELYPVWDEHGVTQWTSSPVA